MARIIARQLALFTMLALGTSCKVKRENQKLTRPISSASRIEVERSTLDEQAPSENQPLTLHIFTGEQGLGFTEESNEKQTHSFGTKEEGWSDGAKKTAIVASVVTAVTAAVVGWRRAGRNAKMKKLNEEIKEGLSKQGEEADQALAKLSRQAKENAELDQKAFGALGVKPVAREKLQKLLAENGAAKFSRRDGMVIAESNLDGGVIRRDFLDIESGEQTKLFVHRGNVPPTDRPEYFDDNSWVIFQKNKDEVIPDYLTELTPEQTAGLNAKLSDIDNLDELTITRVNESEA